MNEAYSTGYIQISAIWKPTAALRWNNGVLEQEWQDIAGHMPTEWRPVPTVEPGATP